MRFRTVLIPAAALAASFVLPGVASAAFILDTGTPTGSSGPVVLNSTQWYAGEFMVASAGETISSLSAFIDGTNSAGIQLAPVGTTFSLDIYANSNGSSNFLTTRVSQLPNSGLLAYSATVTYSGNGWNTVATNWVPTAAGDYWVAMEFSASGRSPPSFDVPLETSAVTGTMPALAFANYSGSEFSTTGASPIGLEVTAVPLPASAWLFASGLLASFGTAFRRRRSNSAE